MQTKQEATPSTESNKPSEPKSNEPKPLKKNPLDTTWLPFRITVEWFTPLIWTGFKKPLQMEDLWDLSEKDKAGVLGEVLEKEWEKRKRSKLGLLGALHRVFWFGVYWSGFLKFCAELFHLGGPLVLKFTLDWLEDSTNTYYPWYLGWILIAVQLICITAGPIIFGNSYVHTIQMMNIRVRSALTSLIYKKSLRLSNKARQMKSQGEILNLMSIDTARMGEIATYIHVAWTGIMSIGVALGMLIYLLGWTTFVGIGVVIVLIPVQMVFIKISQILRLKWIRIVDRRMKMITEVLQGIGIIKFFNWEDQYLKGVNAIRKQELITNTQAICLRAIGSSLVYAAPVLITVSTFIVFAITGGALTSGTVFTAMAYFAQIRYPVMQMVLVLQNGIEGYIAMNRIQTFLRFSEIEERKAGSDPNTPIKLVDASFEWDSKPPQIHRNLKTRTMRLIRRSFRLSKPIDLSNPNALDGIEYVGKISDVNLEIKKGALVMIVGKIGSGKSSLVASIVGETRRASGTISITGKIAYCPQQAWIQNATLRDNILFEQPYDKQRYEEVIRVCALKRDIDILTYGDMTEIGEKGINLSGGQKQRVSLARACYQNSDIYVLDDPLSAVDAHVGRHIFEECIRKYLKDKTRILVTHQVQYLKYATQILVMDNGEIKEQGTFDELIKNKDSYLNSVLEDYNARDAKKDDDEFVPEPLRRKRAFGMARTVASDDVKKEKGKIIQAEERKTGLVSLKVLWNYSWNAGGPISILILLALFTIDALGHVSSDLWMSFWIEARFHSLNTWNPPWGYIIVYASLAIVSAILTFFKTITVFMIGLLAAQKIFSKSFIRVLRAPKSVFDTNPVGRFLARFSRDQEVLDGSMMVSLTSVLGYFFALAATVGVMAYSTQGWVLIAIAILAIIYIVVHQFYTRTSRELKRLESLAKSPLFAQFVESLTGITTIRAYGLTDVFLKKTQHLLDTHLRTLFAMMMASRWLSVRLELLGALVIFSCSIFVVAAKGTISPATGGLALSYSLSITAALAQLVTQSIDVEIQLNALERLDYYMNLENEPIAIKNPEHEPEPEWPSKGEIQFKNYMMRYREGLELVLRGINAHIKSNEKIGIVGRTGSGKSSLMLALFRIVEPASGSIIIDGRDIMKVNLSTLRRKLSIIPQEPVLFTGTIRSNLDPFRQYSDQLLWDVLEKCHLADGIRQLPKKLDTEVTQGGENFSVGERQLLCLARAMCKKAKIIILDECTASVDLETDKLIQKTIDEAFANCTRLTIAHRLNTIMNSDRIMVLDKGQVVEFDTPKQLLQNPKGVFTGLVNQTGRANAKVLKAMCGITVEDDDQEENKTESIKAEIVENIETIDELIQKEKK